jgi:hypothetical protein
MDEDAVDAHPVMMQQPSAVAGWSNTVSNEKEEMRHSTTSVLSAIQPNV